MAEQQLNSLQSQVDELEGRLLDAATELEMKDEALQGARDTQRRLNALEPQLQQLEAALAQAQARAASLAAALSEAQEQADQEVAAAEAEAARKVALVEQLLAPLPRP
ncbi:hypothetical protein HaLaN_04401, partial [Haematococcus lacustris]